MTNWLLPPNKAVGWMMKTTPADSKRMAEVSRMIGRHCHLDLLRQEFTMDVPNMMIIKLIMMITFDVPTAMYAAAA